VTGGLNWAALSLLCYAESMRRYVVIDKHVGETPLQALERFRHDAELSSEIPLAYAGRLDPMASGRLLILIGDECKRQEEYHGLDKEYLFEVLLGVSSDTGDVLGCITPDTRPGLKSSRPGLVSVARELIGVLELPYPHFSSKTVKGKPLHTWTLEGRLDEIEIPTYAGEIYRLDLMNVGEAPIDALVELASLKIESLPPVTDERKAIGNDFRRADVRDSWKTFHESRTQETYTIAQFRCICSSGVYMRTLAEEIAKQLNTTGLALSIHRLNIGVYRKLPFGFGFWLKKL